MTRRLGGLTVFALTMSIAACGGRAGGQGGGKGDAGGQNAAPWAENAGEVTRFADEEPFGPSATIAQDKTKIYASPGGGELVATLPAGTDVTKLAAHGGDVLVCFDEPKPGDRHLMGWVPQSSLQDSAPSPGPGPLPAADDGGVPPSPDPTPPPNKKGRHHHKKGKH
jgi:hypothetical protein